MKNKLYYLTYFKENYSIILFYNKSRNNFIDHYLYYSKIPIKRRIINNNLFGILLDFT